MVLILGLARTPMGAFQGALAGVPAPELGAAALRAAIARAGVEPADLDQIIMGSVLPAGQGQAPARQAALAAGCPLSVGATTINKVCGSGMMAVMLARDMIAAGSARLVAAGGMESMSRAPFLAERGQHFGHSVLADHMLRDGLEDPANHRLMGEYAEDLAERQGFTRAEQDEWALASLERARAADFSGELIGVAGLEADEPPRRAKPDRIANLKPAFRAGGTVTAANASSIADGAAALVLGTDGPRPLARIVAQAGFAQEPALYTTAPQGAIRRVLDMAGWSLGDVDLWEINEAFAVVTLAAMRALDLPPERVNIHGGACALGHPIGATGARILVTLLAALAKYGMKRGVASLCIGGGEATAVALERIEV